MRILFCSHVPLDPRLGVPKHYLELAASFRSLGWETQVVGPDEIAAGSTGEFPEALREYLRREAGEWDVIEYDHACLPYPRSDFSDRPLMVARVMLLVHHFLTVSIPPRPRLRSRIGGILNGWRRRARLRADVRRADETVRQADLTVVSNDRDAAALVARGLPAERIAIHPPGIAAARRPLFDAVPAGTPPGAPVIAFVGTFDPRKGMREFPELVGRVAAAVPGVRFRLLGTAGMVRDAAGVLGHFPRRLRPLVEVRPHFEPDELPGLLAGCSVGVFPSRLESFGYGVLEMQAAAVPVVAYDVPGPHVQLPPDLLVPVGDVRAMAARVIRLLGDPAGLSAAREQARERSRQFVWEEIAARTAETYLRARRVTKADGGRE